MINHNSQESEFLYPSFYDILSIKDQKDYLKLRTNLSSSENKYKRNKRLSSLQFALTEIKKFCIQGNQDDWKRCLVCGICWIGPDIAINTRQLRLIIDKCKSSINGALSKMGYGSLILKGEGAAPLLAALPSLRGNFLEQRMWTIRKKAIFSPAPNGYWNYQQYSNINFFITPQPNPIYQQTEINQNNDIQTIFKVPEIPKETQCPKNESNQLLPDFLQDPCCCCPIDWVNQETADDDFLAYG